MVLVKEKNHKKSSKKIYLRPLKVHDKDKICQWMTNPYLIEYSFVVPGLSSIPYDFYTKAYALRYFNLLIDDPNRKTYAIMNRSNHIGNIGLKDINPYLGSAECFIEIGENEQRGKGFGLLAMKLLIELGFSQLALRVIELDVLEFNISAIKIYQKLGFKTLSSYAWHYDEFGVFWKVLRMRLHK